MNLNLLLVLSITYIALYSTESEARFSYLSLGCTRVRADAVTSARAWGRGEGLGYRSLPELKAGRKRVL